MAVYYSVKPTQVFFAAETSFYPGRGEYLISEEVYNGKTADGQSNVKDLCEQPANQVNLD
jgi:hypothetical protein